MSEIAPQTRPGPVHLTVSDLARSLDYYRSSIGLSVLEQGPGRARLGADGNGLLVLVEEPGRASGGRLHGPVPLRAARPRAPRACRAGSPTRRATASRSSALRPLRQRGAVPLRPRRPRDRDLLGPPARGLGGPGRRAADDAAARRRRSPRRARRSRDCRFDGLPAGTVMGHVHLKVASSRRRSSSIATSSAST